MWLEKSRGLKLKKTEVELFSGEFWSGKKAKDLGLIDEIGDVNQVCLLYTSDAADE